MEYQGPYSPSYDRLAARPDKKWVLAINPAIGAIYRCENCRNIHFELSGVHFQVTPDTYFQLVDLISRSASNFELMMEAEGGV
jgi:hypothetical protein